VFSDGIIIYVLQFGWTWSLILAMDG
jgi:hypothetical protein